MKPYHKHLLIQAYVNDPPLEDETYLNAWLAQLVNAIGMKMVFKPRSKYVDVSGNKGLTGSVNIETSHIAIHIWIEETPTRIEMDVYSCKDFEVETVINQLKLWDLVRLHYWLIDRNNNEFDLIEKGTI